MLKHGKIVWSIIVFVVVMILFITIGWSLLLSRTLLEGKEYSSVEELHSAYKQALHETADDSYDFWIKDLVYYERVEDIVYVVCTYAASEDSEIVQDELFVYFVRVNASDKYELLKGLSGGWAVVKLNGDYSLGGNYYYFSKVKLGGQKKSICFLYKEIGNKNKILFDGNATTEVISNNPFQPEEQFYLCYGFPKPDTFWGNMVNSIEKRHVCSYSS